MVCSELSRKSFSALNTSLLSSLGLVYLFFLTSCNPTKISSSHQRSGQSSDNTHLANKALIYRDNPSILAGPHFGPDVDMSAFIDKENSEFITSKNQLKSDCTLRLFNGTTTLSDCLYSYASKTASQQLLARPSDESWVFEPNTKEFYQVNALFHVQKGVTTFFDKLKFAYDTLHSNPLFIPVAKSIPYYLPQTGLFWFQAPSPSNDLYFRNSFLSSYALCNLELNAQFNPAGPDLCFGKWAKHPSFFFVQDPSVIYHELGHALIAVMMNFRNGIPGSPIPSYHPLRSNLGGYGYDEAGSIGEGVADYFSFVMNERTHFGEWALGKSVRASRPISENDKLHISPISTTSEGRLSYPQYLLYDPNDPNVPYEDVHYAGQIVSHYLVALTQSLQRKCSLAQATAHSTSTSYVMLLLAETFSELGDLRSIGFDLTSPTPVSSLYRFANLDENASYLWSQVVHPTTFRKFFQFFSKNILKYISSGLCTSFTKNDSEKLLDDYGLLLFKTYNNNGSSTKNKFVQHSSSGAVSTNVTPVAPTGISENNRRKTVLVSKELLSLATPDADKDVSTYYIIDDQTNISAVLKNLLFKGFPINISTGIASVEYNNSNIRVSPGEIVAIIPNLFNSSNSPMAGINLLATDWDHVHITDISGRTGNFAPCVVDDVTTVAQGAEAAQTCTSTMTTYQRHIKANGFFSSQAAAPVCLVELSENNATRWVSQNEFRRKQGLSLEDKDCLGYSGTAYTDDLTFNPHECLVRALPGANRAYFSKIDPQKSYIETMRNGNPKHAFGPGNAILFEVNKWIPPGTKFRCRLRAKFSNCADCFSDPTDLTHDEYIDAEYNGAKGFKIINMEFDVND